MLKVLIIEDEVLIGIQIKNYLIKKGINVVGVVSNFVKAYELFNRYRPELLICNIHLTNGESGIDVVNDLRKVGCFEVLYLASYSDNATLQKAFASKPLNYITKPIKEIDIYAAVMLCFSRLQEAMVSLQWNYDISTKILRQNGNIVHLSKQENDLFHLCYINLGQYVPMELIENSLWSEKNVSSTTKRGLFHRLDKRVGKSIFEHHSLYGCRLQPQEMGARL